MGQWSPMDSPTCPMVQLDRTDSGIWGPSGGTVDSHGQSQKKKTEKWMVHWTGGLDRWTGQDSGISSEGGMSNGCPMDVHWTGSLDRTVGKAWSVRVTWDVQWTSHGHPLDR